MRVEWITVCLIAGTYGGWVLAGLYVWPAFPALALTIMAILSGFHSSLVHECIHGHPTRKRWLNELLVFVNPSLIWPYRRFRTLHLRHHHDAHLTDPFEDPESYYRAQWQFRALPRWFRWVLRLNNTMMGRIILGPPLGTVGLIAGDIRAIANGDSRIRNDWILHIMGVVPVVLAVVWWFGIPLWLYLVTVCWGGLALISVRTFAEHRWFETVEGRTIIVEKTPLSLLFLNNNLHIVHHMHPSAPWYELPRLFRERRDFWIQFNGGYVFRNYTELFLRWGFRQKEWVDHPVLHTEPGASFSLDGTRRHNNPEQA